MEESACKSATIASLEENVRRHLDTIGEANAHIREDELLRRKLHNTIQEMKGQPILAVWDVGCFFVVVVFFCLCGWRKL